MSEKSLIVIPCYNEEQRFDRVAYLQYLETSNSDILFVNDGSSDQTEKMLLEIYSQQKHRIKVLSLPKNVGKAEAIRQGICSLRSEQYYKYVGYLDADLAAPLSEWDYLLKYIVDDNREMVFGSRVKRIGVDIERSFIRHYIGRLFATVVSLMLNIPIYDSQCGIKIFSIMFAQQIFSTPFISKWVFEVEIFARAIDAFGYDSIHMRLFEVPLRSWHEKGDSKLKYFDFIKAPYDLLKIYFCYKSSVKKMVV